MRVYTYGSKTADGIIVAAHGSLDGLEIFSEGSGPDDLVRKNAEYQATPSIQRYVVLQQATKGATVFARRGKLWAAEVAQGPDAVLDTPEIGIAVPLGDLYLAVPLAPTDGDPPA